MLLTAKLALDSALVSVVSCSRSAARMALMPFLDSNASLILENEPRRFFSSLDTEPRTSVMLRSIRGW